MIIVRFKAKCRPDKILEAISAFEGGVAPSRRVKGVIHFDIARDLTDPDAIVATEVFEDKGALARQEVLPSVQQIIGKLPGWLAAPPEATIYHISSSEPWGS
ncbi:MAG: antibiotic biosynthesis monooxygenase [Dehalococcoidia bacterium]|nr:antibiotic biosynthesis monooxygenase [Dehalococcoidia bacterium]